jgi:O-antigen/teichoic acid export membrane protein
MLINYLAASGFGQYSFAFSFAAVFIIFSDFGFDALTIRNVARNRELGGDYLEVVGLLRVGLSLIMIAIALVAGYMLGLDEYLLTVILVAGLVYLFDKVSGLFYALFRAYERMELEAGVQIAWKVIQVSLGLIAMYLGFTLLEIVMFLLVASVIRCIIGFSILLAMGIKPSRKSVKPKYIVKKSMPFAAYEIGNAVYFNLIIIMLFFFQSDVETGWYNAAFRMFMFLIIIPTAFETAIYPLFSRLYAGSDHEMKFAYGKSMKYTLLAAIPVAMLLMVLSEDITRPFFSDFIYISQCLKFIAIALPFFALNMLMKTALWSAESQVRMAINIWASTMILAVAAFFLVSEEGYVGAALALVVGEIALFVLNSLAVRKKRFPMGRYLWRPVAAGTGMIGIALLLSMFFDRVFSSYHVAVFSGIVYALLLLAFSTFTKTDRRLMLSALKLRPRTPR